MFACLHSCVECRVRNVCCDVVHSCLSCGACIRAMHVCMYVAPCMCACNAHVCVYVMHDCMYAMHVMYVCNFCMEPCISCMPCIWAMYACMYAMIAMECGVFIYVNDAVRRVYVCMYVWRMHAYICVMHFMHDCM